VGGRVDEPSSIEGKAVPEYDSDKVANPKTFPPEVPWNKSGDNEAAAKDTESVVLPLVMDNRVS